MYRLRKTQVAILSALREKSGPTSPREIADVHGLNPSTVRSELVNLNSFGLVEHWRGIRGLYIITATGKRALKEFEGGKGKG